MTYISCKISGVPYAKTKRRGNTNAPKIWTETIINATKDLPKIKEACILRVTFLLPTNKFPKDLPYGPDLDNLMKRFSDALNKTIFSNTEGKDSCIVELVVMKAKVNEEKDAGAVIEVLPVGIR